MIESIATIVQAGTEEFSEVWNEIMRKPFTPKPEENIGFITESIEEDTYMAVMENLREKYNLSLRQISIPCESGFRRYDPRTPGKDIVTDFADQEIEGGFVRLNIKKGKNQGSIRLNFHEGIVYVSEVHTRGSLNKFFQLEGFQNKKSRIAAIFPPSYL